MVRLSYRQLGLLTFERLTLLLLFCKRGKNIKTNEVK